MVPFSSAVELPLTESQRRRLKDVAEYRRELRPQRRDEIAARALGPQAIRKDLRRIRSPLPKICPPSKGRELHRIAEDTTNLRSMPSFFLGTSHPAANKSQSDDLSSISAGVTKSVAVHSSDVCVAGSL